MRIELADPESLSDDDLRGVHEIDAAVQREVKPDVPERTPEQFIAFQREPRPEFHRRYQLAREGDEIVGVGWLGWTVGEENRHLARGHVAVAPARRRQGIGRQLLRAVARYAEADRRRLLQSWTSSRVPAGEAFAKAAGARAGMITYENRLAIKSVDVGRLRRWVASGEALSDYELVTIDGPTPPELLAEAAAVLNVMNSAPRDDLQEEDSTLTPEMLAANERAWLASGRRGLRMYIRHRPSGRFVGLTQIGWSPSDRRVLGQGDTGVLPEHRGLGLAKWLKAAMLLRVLDEIPEAEAIYTGNAVSNDAMLAINRALGFEPVGNWTVWELETGAVS